jgi:hypothetical protein
MPHEEDTAIKNVHAPNNRRAKHETQKLKEQKEKRQIHT